MTRDEPRGFLTPYIGCVSLLPITPRVASRARVSFDNGATLGTVTTRSQRLDPSQTGSHYGTASRRDDFAAFRSSTAGARGTHLGATQNMAWQAPRRYRGIGTLGDRFLGLHRRLCCSRLRRSGGYCLFHLEYAARSARDARSGDRGRGEESR